MPTLATMITSTTYGTWLRGDRRGWVDDGRILPALPWLEANDRTRMKHEPYLFDEHRLLDIGKMIGNSLVERHNLKMGWAAKPWSFITDVNGYLAPALHRRSI
jgi:hypothetical protein